MKRINLQDDTAVLENLEVIKSIGEGMFGNVFLVRNILNGNTFALKTVSRKKISAYNLTNALIAERSILLSVDHTMIVKLIKTFKDDRRVYFLCEHVDGIDLFDALRKIGLCKNQDAKFYVA